MYLTRSEYDRGVNTFSPEGRLFQVCIGMGVGTMYVGNQHHLFLKILLFPTYIGYAKTPSLGRICD
jgi:hypothetical protein